MRGLLTEETWTGTYLVAANVASGARLRAALDGLGIRETEFLDAALSWLNADSAGLKGSIS